MIAKGKIRGDGAKLARYLMTGENGEVAQLVETRGLEKFARDPVTAFDRMEQWAGENTRCRAAFFHQQIRLAPGERLEDRLWMDAVDRSEKRHGFTGQPRMVSFHIDPATGEKHLHVAWFRVDLEAKRAIDPGMYKNHLKQLSRTLEREYGLREVSSQRKPGQARAANRKELEQSRRLDTDGPAIRAAILDCLQQADGGKAFKAALETQGLMLANGDRRDCFVVVDQAGGHHALNKALTGQTLAQTRDRLADLDRSQLPSVEQAQAMQAERQRRPDREAAPPGLTRMYRGIGSNVWEAQSGDALFFSTDPARAAAFGQLHYVDVTAAEMAKFERPHSKRILEAEPIAVNDWRTADPAIIARLRPLEAERHRTQEPAQEARQRPEPEPGRETRAGQGRAAQAPEKRPLGKTAAQINAAWTETRNPSDLAASAAAFRQAIEDRGPILVYVSAEEAYASERVAAFAREIGGTIQATPGKDGPPVWMQQRGGIEALSAAHRESAERSYERWIENDPAKAERHDLVDYVAYVQRQWEQNQQTPGERQPPRRTFKEGFAVVDARGTVTRIDERTTGDKRAEIEQRLASIDRSQLLTVAQARDVMKEASRAAWAARKQAERNAARPVTKIEAKIIDAHQQANGDRQKFDAALEKAGLGLARVTAADRTALDALRQDEVLTAAVNPAHKMRYFPKLEAGELAAVDRFGGVHRLNPHHVQEIDRQTRAEVPAWTKLPSVVELRAGFESDRDLREKFRQAVKDGYAKDRQAWMREHVTRTQERAANRTMREVVGKVERAAVLPVAGGGKAVNKVYGFVARGLSAVLRIRPLGILTAFDFGAGKPDSREQAHQKAQAAGNVETQHAESYAAATQAKAAEFDGRMHAQKTADQQQDLSSSQRSGRPATREANLGRGRDDDYERERER